MRATKPDPIHLTDDEPSGTPPPYATLGLDEHSLRQRLSDEADRRQGEMIGVAFPGRGAVVWHGGQISILGPAGERNRELLEAVAALVEGADLSSLRVVRDLLVTMAGARLVVHRIVVDEPGNIGPQLSEPGGR